MEDLNTTIQIYQVLQPLLLCHWEAGKLYIRTTAFELSFNGYYPITSKYLITQIQCLYPLIYSGTIKYSDKSY